jgi:hypothetical protein
LPIARTWSEELVIEWMTLSGYLVELGLPILGLGLPGRPEVDAVGARHDGTNLEILHVEVGSSGSDTGTINSKFNTKVTGYVSSHVNQILSISGMPAKYTKVYVALYLPDNFDPNQTPGITVHSFHDFMEKEVKPAITAWKKNNTSNSGYAPELPESFWLLKFLDYLNL